MTNREKYNFDYFTIEHYRELVKLAKDQGFQFILHKDVFIPDRKDIIWRHDVEFSPDIALKMAEIESLYEAAGRDKELIEIRSRITAAAASQLKNGTITASQYMTELNNEKQAVIAAAARKISITRAETEYLYITGYKTEE